MWQVLALPVPGRSGLADAGVLRAEPTWLGPVASDPVISRLVTRLADDAPAALQAIRRPARQPGRLAYASDVRRLLCLLTARSTAGRRTCRTAGISALLARMVSFITAHAGDKPVIENGRQVIRMWAAIPDRLFQAEPIVRFTDRHDNLYYVYKQHIQRFSQATGFAHAVTEMDKRIRTGPKPGEPRPGLALALPQVAYVHA